MNEIVGEAALPHYQACVGAKHINQTLKEAVAEGDKWRPRKCTLMATNLFAQLSPKLGTQRPKNISVEHSVS